MIEHIEAITHWRIGIPIKKLSFHGSGTRILFNEMATEILGHADAKNARGFEMIASFVASIASAGAK